VPLFSKADAKIWQVFESTKHFEENFQKKLIFFFKNAVFASF
jgi:hypothetical protein